MEDKSFYNLYVKRESPISAALDAALTVTIVVLCALLALLLIFEPITVSGISMNPTIADGDRVAVNKISREFERGDIVVAEKGDYYIIKRVIAIEGDEIAFGWNNGEIKLYINDFTQPVTEAYIKEPMTDSERFDRRAGVSIAPNTEEESLSAVKITIGEGEVFLMGDNRNNSTDSRLNGKQKISSVMGKMAFNITESNFWNFIFDIIYKINKESM